MRSEMKFLLLGKRYGVKYGIGHEVEMFASPTNVRSTQF